MNILIPKNVFLRVEDKFVPGFIDSDQAVATSPTLLYRKLFAECYATGKCRLPQKYLAGQCKFSVRTLQYAQTRLVELGYIHVEHTPGECSSYILLLSDRVKKLLVDYDLLDRSEWYPRPAKTPPQNLQGRYAKAAEPSYKEDKKEKSAPLSPHAPASCKSAPSARKPFPSTTPVPNPQAGGWGDSFSKGKKPGKASGFQTANTLFERFFAAYPRKEAREPARAVWHQLWRRGALPALDHLLAALDRFRASTGWIKEHGRFVPYLVNWLRGRRWADEAGAPGASSSGAQSTPPSGTPSPTPDQQPIPRIAAFTPPAALETPEGKIFQKDYGLAVTELHALWPTASRNSIRSGLLMARLRGFGLKDVVARAREYARGNVLPRLSLGDWIKQEVFA